MSSTALLVDRFVSASSADDARDSLKGIVAALQATASEGSEDHLEPSIVWNEEETLEAFLQVLTTGEYKGIPIDQGPPIVCQVYSELIKAKDSSVILDKPQRGRLVQSLLDVICNPDDSAYARVSSLQVLQKICHKYPSLAQTQLLEVPNGLHRLADMFREDNEQVRNEVLLLAKVIAQWPSCAKIWVFAEVCDSVIELAVQEGGLTKGNVLVVDCLDLLHSLLKHDASLADLVWQSPVFATKLSSLLDLRRGTEFVNPKKPLPTDDLDDILQSGTEEAKPVVPRLTGEEESLLVKLIDLIGVMLGSETIRKTVWKQHLALGSLVWELSLLSPPPPGVPHVCSVPSANLQQKALNCVAEFFSSLETMQRHNGLDRLLYLVCTGGASEKFEEKLGLSQSALQVIRQTLSDDIAKEIVMHTLAPPTSDDSSEPEPTVVLKLLNTVVENVKGEADLDRRKINLLGSLGALGVFMRDATSREMMLRIASPHSLIDDMLKSLESQDEVIALSFLRFLSEWMVDTPAVVEAVLSSTQSTSLSVLFGSVGGKSVLTGLLLGMAMEYMDDQRSEKYGGWTRASILAMVSKWKGGISGFVSELEDFKTLELPWKACRLEESTFFKWYNAQVLLVRSRIVQQLTGGVGEDEDEDQGVGSKALPRLVAQQSQELLELQKALAETKNELESRKSQLSIWKRRVESTPTQLDDMLSEYTSKNVQLESEISTLRTELQSVRELNQLQLKENEDQIDELRQEVEICKEREQGVTSDTDRLRGELSAVSSAYSNLEEEYNRSQLANSNTAPTGEVADPQVEGQQPQGEVSSQGQAGSEADALRAENARLRNDARAADEWMQLAHQRMGEIGSQNLALLEEVASMKEIPDSTSAPVDDLRVRAEQQLQETRQRCSELEEEVAGLRDNSTSLEVDPRDVNGLLQNEQRLRMDLEEKLKNAQLDVAAAMDSLGESKSSKEGMLREIDEFKTELQLAQASATALNEERRQLEMQLSTQDPTEGELVSRLQADLQAKQQELDSLQSSIESLQDELADSKSAVGVSISESDGSSNRDPSAEIEGHGSLTAGVGQQAREREFEQLQAANVAAQEWMEKAVEHHQMLSDQLAALEADKEELKKQLKAGQGRGLADDTEHLHERLVASNTELELLKTEFHQSEADALRTSSDFEVIKDSLEAEVTRLLFELDSRGEEVQLLEGRVSLQESVGSEAANEGKIELQTLRDTLDRTREEQTLKIEDLQAQIVELTDDRNGRTVEISEMTMKVNEFEQGSAVARERLNQLSTEKEAAEQELSEWKTAASGLEGLTEKLKTENKSLSERLEILENELNVKSTEVTELQAEVEEQEGLVNLTESSLQQTKAEQEETENQNLVVMQQWQERASELEATANEMKAILANQERETTDAVEQWTQHCSQLEEKVERLESELQELSAAGDLESTITSLERSLETQQQEGTEAIEIWSSRCNELSDMIIELKKAYEALSEEKQMLETTARDASDLMENKRELNEALSIQIQVIENELSSTKSRMLEVSEEKEKTIEELKRQVDLQAATIVEHEERTEAREQSLEELRSEMDTVQSASNTLVAISEERIQELESSLVIASEKLEVSENEATAAGQEWQSHCKILEEEKSKLSDDLRNALAEREALDCLLESKEREITEQLEAERDARLVAEETVRDAETDMDSVAKQSEEAINQWQDRVAELENQLEQQQVAAMDAITQWEGACDKLQAEVADLESGNDQVSRALLDALRAVQKKHLNWVNMLVDHYDGITDFDIPAETPAEEIPALLSSSAESYDQAMVKGIQDLKSYLASYQETSQVLEKTLKSKDIELEKTTNELLDLKSLSADQDDAAGKLENRCTELESALSLERNRITAAEVDLESTKTQLDEKTNLINDKETQLQQHVADLVGLRAKLVSTVGELANITRERDDAETRNQAMKRELSGTATSLKETQKRLEQTAAERSKIEEALATQQQATQEIEARWAADKIETTAHDSSLREERDNLQAEAVRLEDELKSTNESLQAHITDEVSRRATEMATQALRSEMEQMRSQIDGGQDALLEERRSRLVAEKEISSLKSDLALVLRVQDDGSSNDKIKSLVMKTADGIQQKERQEIEELRNALERILQELESSRAVENEASNRASAAELQASICEQEVIAAKSDVAFLTQSLEETREAEAARVASFEYRISALEEDRDVVRRFHADELETLRHELSHSSMEKDHILHSLKESEKTNAALVYSTSKELETDGAGHAQSELSKLRSSNAQLLSAATEEAARTERRIREAIVTNASLVEADVIVERELRVAAESALENVKSQLDEARRSQLDEPARRTKQILSPDRLKTQLSQAREKSRKLEAENSSLRGELEEIKSDSEAKVSDLTDRCQRAQSLVLKFEGEAQFDSEVSSEVLKIHSLSSQSASDNWVVVRETPQDMVDTSSRVDGMSSAETYDFITEQKIAIQEERQMYQELLAEHDDLLVLLAQQDLEKASLNEALMNVAGQSAVDAAIQEAEENAVKQFGKYVRLA